LLSERLAKPLPRRAPEEHQRHFAVDHPLFMIKSSYIAHCMGACSANGEWSLFSLSLSLSLYPHLTSLSLSPSPALLSLSPLYTVEMQRSHQLCVSEDFAQRV